MVLGSGVVEVVEVLVAKGTCGLPQVLKDMDHI